MTLSRTELLLSRLDEIGASLARSGKALALIGLGSAGLELDRLDRYSDLDFFAIVENGHKREVLEDLSWLGGIHPIAYSFRNTPDGYKVLFADGIFCEFAVFEAPELEQIPFAPGRMVWKKDGVPDDLRFPRRPQPSLEERSVEWSLGEALTNLYAGLCRYRRGERLAAMRLIQLHAVDRLLELAERIDPAAPSPRDPFALERRYEQRHPRIAQALPSFAQGYERSVESGRAILGFLDGHFELNPAMRRAILELCDSAPS
jgi:lincosamide nucleotidyltransferase B/F